MIELAHNADVMERALMGFAVIVPGPCVTDFTTGNRVARRGSLKAVWGEGGRVVCWLNT